VCTTKEAEQPWLYPGLTFFPDVLFLYSFRKEKLQKNALTCASLKGKKYPDIGGNDYF